MSDTDWCHGCSGACCTGVGSDPCTCEDRTPSQGDDLKRAAATLRDIAPELPDNLRGLADPTAEWLESMSGRRAVDGVNLKALRVAINVAEAINGD